MPKELSGLPLSEKTAWVSTLRLGDRAAGRVTLGNEERRFVRELVLGVQVGAAVTQLLVVDLGHLGSLAGQLLDAFHLLAFVLGALDLFSERSSSVLVAVEVVVELQTDEVADKSSDRFAVRRHVGGAELGLGLGFEDGIFYLHGNGSDDATPDVSGVILLLQVRS